MEDLRLELKVKNNLLYRAIMEKHKGIAEFCRKHGLQQTPVGQYLNFKRSPLSRHKPWVKEEVELIDINGLYVKASAIKIAEALGKSFFDLFPPASYESKQNTFIAEVDSQDFIPFDDTVYLPILDDVTGKPEQDYGELYEVLHTLTDRERSVLIDRFGIHAGEGMTLVDCGKKNGGVSKDRIRQIQAKALRKLRHPSRSRRVRPLFEA
jgi:hypothetical protein